MPRAVRFSAYGPVEVLDVVDVPAPVPGPGEVAGSLFAATGGPIDAFIDAGGGGYVDLALELGVRPARIDTIVDWDRAAQVGAKTDGNMVGARAEVLAELAELVAQGELEIPIDSTYPLDEVRAAYRELEHQHTRGKIVLVP